MKKRDELQEEYHFMKETIKEKPVNIRGFLLRCAGLLAGAVVFGLVSALVFVHFFPIFQEQMQGGRVVFEEDDPNISATNVQGGNNASNQGDANSHTLDGTVSGSDISGNADKDTSGSINGNANENTNENTTGVVGKNNEGNNVSESSGLDGGAVNGTAAGDSNAEGETSMGIHQEMSTIESYQQIQEDLNAIAKNAMKSMVTVSGISDEEDWFYVATESIEHASGVIIAENTYEFYILTKYHAVDGVDRVMVTFHDGSIADGRYQKHDKNTGMTVLKVAKADLPDGKVDNMKVAALGNSYQVQQGESVIAIGSPMGYSNSVVYGQMTSTTSIASAYDAQYNLFITNILGSDDGSGMLINLSGEIIGVITQEFAKDNHKNVITCLPISQLKSMITALSNNEELPYLGIKGQKVTAEITKQTGMPKGIYISEVKSDSPALQAGIRKADILTKYNGKAIESMHQYSEILSTAKPGDVIEVTVMRKGAEGYVEFHFEVTLGSR